jgi:hypothetical protein
MPHLVDYPLDDDVDFQMPVSPSSPYRRASAPTVLPSHAAKSSTKTKVKSWWTTATGGGTDHYPDEIPDIIDTSSSSRDYGVMGVAYEDECEGHPRQQQQQQQQYRYSLGAARPSMAPPSRNESSSSINSMPGGHEYGARDHVDNSDYEDDDNCLKRQQVHPDPYYRHLPPPPIPSPSARSIRSKQQQHRRSHRRSAVERRRSQKQHQPFNDYDDDDLLYQQHQQQFPRSSSSSSSGGAGTGGAASSHSHPSRASSRGGGGGGRRSSSNSIASGGPNRHSYPGRRSATSSAARSKTDKDKLLISSSSSSKRGWWCLSSPRTLFRMLSFAGILSVSLTVLANRNLLLVGDPNNHLTSPLNANSVINWNSRDSFSLHYGNEHVSSSVSSMSSSSSSSSSLFLQYPAADSATAAAAATAAVAVAATTAAKAVTTARLETSTAASSSGLLRGKDKRSSVSTSPPKGDSSANRAAARSSSTSTFTSDQRRVRHLSKDADSSVPSGPHLTLLIPQHRSEGKADQRAHLSGVVVPQGKLAERRFESQDRNLYTYHTPDPFAGSSSTNALLREADRRVATLHASWKQHEAAAAQRGRGSSLTYPRRKLQLYPPDFTDPTQLYGILDSGDERVKMMERRPPLVQGECVPMQEWQTTFHPSCNQLHESIDLAQVGAKPQQSGSELDLFGTKGYWRNAWKVNTFGPRQVKDTVVLKTLK